MWKCEYLDYKCAKQMEGAHPMSKDASSYTCGVLEQLCYLLLFAHQFIVSFVSIMAQNVDQNALKSLLS